MKNLTRLFALVAMVAFIGCATTGGGSSAVNTSDGGGLNLSGVMQIIKEWVLHMEAMEIVTSF